MFGITDKEKMPTKTVLVSVLFSFVMIFAACSDSQQKSPDPIERKLPHYGVHDPNPEQPGDTLYYTVPKFSFVNQNKREVSHRDYAGKIYVTDFFFTTCPTICPIMSSQMSRLQSLLQNENLQDQVMLLSHTVNPENDGPDELKAYAEKIGADTRNWHFVTGSKEDLYYQAKNGYFINALESDTAAGGFIHSDNFILIDRNSHIRGYYDGTSTREVDSLLQDIKLLLKEE